MSRQTPAEGYASHSSEIWAQDFPVSEFSMMSWLPTVDRARAQARRSWRGVETSVQVDDVGVNDKVGNGGGEVGEGGPESERR